MGYPLCVLLHVLGREGVAIGAGGNGRIFFVCADLDLVKRAVIFAVTVILALSDGAFDALVDVSHRGVAARRIVHGKLPFKLRVRSSEVLGKISVDR